MKGECLGLSLGDDLMRCHIGGLLELYEAPMGWMAFCGEAKRLMGHESENFH